MTDQVSIFPLSPGLVDGKHRRNMGLAIWEFLWFLEHVTSDEPDGKGKFDGVVDFGNPISPATVAREIGSNARCVQRNIQKLVSAGYLVRRRELANGNSYVVKNSKRWIWKRAHLAGIPTPSASGGATDLDAGGAYESVAGVRTNPSRRVTESVTSGDGLVRSNKERKSRRAEEKILKPSPDGEVTTPTSNPSRSISNPSGESSTDQGGNLAAGAAAKLSSPAELILTPPEPSSPPKETQHADVERFIKSTYKNATDQQCPWNGRTGKALKDFLASHCWTTEVITRCVTNRFKSEGAVIAEDPHFWIPNLAGYLQGPKDKFGKTKAVLSAAPKTKAPRAVVNLPPPTAQPENDALIRSWKRNA